MRDAEDAATTSPNQSVDEGASEKQGQNRDKDNRNSENCETIAARMETSGRLLEKRSEILTTFKSRRNVVTNVCFSDTYISSKASRFGKLQIWCRNVL